MLLCLVAQSCLILCVPMDCYLPGFSIHGILQARTLERVACPLSGDLPNPNGDTAKQSKSPVMSEKNEEVGFLEDDDFSMCLSPDFFSEETQEQTVNPGP